MLRKIAFVTGILFWLGTASLPADELLLEQFYGNGVHAYNQGDYQGAYEALSSAISGGTNDPRAYYFRGLTYLKLGRDPEAKADFQAGAELEVGDSADVYPVNRSLERVQGSSRQMLEQYRTKIHAAAVQRKEKERQVRYEQRAAAEQEVLRQVAPTQMPSNSAEQPVPSAGNSGENAGSSKGANSVDKPATEPVKNPFETEPSQPVTKPVPASSDNPFGGSDTKPAQPAASTPTPAVSDDPFGSTQPAAQPTKPATEMPVPHTEHSDSGATVQPTAGGLGSLYRAVVKGSKSDQAVPASAANQSLPGMIQGIFGHGPAAPSGAVPANASPAPVPGGAGPPPPDNTNPLGDAAPAATNPAAMPTTAPPATVTPMPGGGQPATQPTTPAPAQQNNPPPPKDNDNPFN